LPVASLFIELPSLVCDGVWVRCGPEPGTDEKAPGVRNFCLA
jgi:hypothetical protein